MPDREAVVLSPSPKFYELFNAHHVRDIVTNLAERRTVPLQYGYFGSGSDYWVRYMDRLVREQEPNYFHRSQELLALNAPYLDSLIARSDAVHVIDVGAGDGRPARALLKRWRDAGTVVRYTALDISPAMLDILQVNMREWFGALPVETQIADITKDGLSALPASRERNIALLLGGMISNLDAPDGAFKNVRGMLSPGDLLVYTVKPDTASNRQYLDFSVDGDGQPTLADHERQVLELIGIHEGMYVIEKGYDESRCRRFIRIRLNRPVTIQFRVGDSIRPVALREGETVGVWHANHQDVMQIQRQLLATGFYPLQVSHSPDREFLLCIAQVVSAD